MAENSIDRVAGRLSNIITIWPVLVPAGAFGVLMGYLAKGVTQINQFGAFGWCFAGLISFLLVSWALLAISGVWSRWVIARAARRHALPPDSINPLEGEFRLRRIRLHALAHPIKGRIKGKKFYDCELEGPANLVLMGEGLVKGAGFVNCDFVIHTIPAHIQNCIVVDSCDIIGGEISRCTIFTDQDFFDANFKPFGVTAITYERP